METMRIEEDGMDREIKLPVPMGWKVLVRPKQAPKQSAGGIVYAESTTEAEQALVYVGQVLALGDAAFTAKTQGGISLSHIVKPKVGDWVIYAPFAGQKIRVKGDDSLLILMNDTELQGIIANPDDYYAWVD